MKFSKKTTFISVSSIAILALGLWGCGMKSGKPLVRIGNETITESDLDTLTRVNPRLKPRLSTPAGRDKILDNYVEQELLYQESTRQGLDKTTDVKDKIALYEKIIVAQALMEKELAKKVREYYDNHKDEFERVKVSHILIKVEDAEEKKVEKKDVKVKTKDAKKEAPKAKTHTEAEATKIVQEIQDKLSKGEDFATLAKTYSEDEKTKDTQGDLGYITIRDKKLERWNWLPLAEKAFSLELDKVSDPVKTKDGIHLVKLTEAKSTIPFEESETGLQFRLQADLKNELINDLKKKYKVEYVKDEKAAQPAKPVAAPEAPPTAPPTQPEGLVVPTTPPAAAPAPTNPTH